MRDKIQTPDVDHEEAWWQLVMISYTQLYLSRQEADNHRTPWETSSFKLKAEQTIKQPTQVQKDFERIIQEIGTPARPPIVRKIAPGRQAGDFQIKRTRHAIVTKRKKDLFDKKMTA